MNALKHVLEPHIKLVSKEATTQEEKLEAQQALFALKRTRHQHVWWCRMFPILLQMPFFSAIYFAAQHTEGVAQTEAT